MRLQAGIKLGHYQILAPLGTGGMGEVYRARDGRLQRDVAIKVLPERLVNSAEALARFEREARTLASLSHPNLLTIFDVGTEQGISFAVMECLAGETLRDRLVGGALPLPHALEIGIAVAQGLGAAHAQGVIHRDLKPANVFLTNQGSVKILDFGLARSVNALSVESTVDFVTEIGRVLGTVGYMSPEQAHGDIPDERGDLFSFGCVLYEMVTGRRAFPGDKAVAVLAAILRDEPTEMDASGLPVPPALKQLVARCLAKQADARYSSADDLVLALKAVTDGETRPIPVVVAESSSRPCLAVLPLRNLSANKGETDYFMESMTEALIAELARNRALRVVSRTTVMQFQDARKPLREIAHELEADAILEGSVLLAGPAVRITAQLIRADSDEHLWAETYQRNVDDVLAVQSEVARTVAETVKEVMFEEVYRTESRRVLATLIRHLGDIDLAEQALEEAFVAARQQWPSDGVPPDPREWLVSTGRMGVLDSIRSRARLDPSLRHESRQVEEAVSVDAEGDEQAGVDDRLRLIFTCAHPALPRPAQMALMLREVCGLTNAQIARALGTAPATVASHLARGKSKIRNVGMPYAIPPTEALPERLAGVLHVAHQVFRGRFDESPDPHSASPELAREAIRLGRLIVELYPDPEALGLLALMLLQESRRDAQTSSSGEHIPLEAQDRTRWNAAQIQEGLAWLERATISAAPGPYTIQAAIEAIHARAVDAEATDWEQILGLYDALLRIAPSPTAAENRAAALAHCCNSEALNPATRRINHEGHGALEPQLCPGHDEEERR